MSNTYTKAQITQYLQRINYPQHKHPSSQLDFLHQLVLQHLTHVPFENIALHYTQSQRLSLKLDDLFDKIVVKRRGGYCMELNALFLAVLRSLGFEAIGSAGRVKVAGRFQGLNHMVVIAKLKEERYLIDVGYGSDVPLQPVKLAHNFQFSQFGAKQGKIEYRSIDQHVDPSQKLWIYLMQDGKDAAWEEQYCFFDHEFIPEDFELLNLAPMSDPKSYFVNNVMGALAVQDGNVPTGMYTLFNGTVKKTDAEGTKVVMKFETEEERVKMFEDIFGIVLTDEEAATIRGRVTELDKAKSWDTMDKV